MTAQSTQEPEPQPVVNPLTAAAIFLVLTVSPGGEDAVRGLLPDLSGLGRSVGFRIPEGSLQVITAIGSDAWDRLFEGPRPRELHPFRELAGSRHTAPATPGDLLFHIKANRMDLCFEFAAQVMRRLSGAVGVADEVQGFRYFDERDLIGFVDGTESPPGAAGVSAAIVGADDDPGFAGGSYVIVQKYLHDMAAWNALSIEEQERVIGRSKLDDIEMPDEVKPANSHVALNTITGPDGEERQIVRANMPFGNPGQGEFGTYYIGYAATPAVTEEMLVNMFIGRPPGNTDRILDFSTAITGCLFFAPCADFLDDPPGPPGAVAVSAATDVPGTFPAAPPVGDGSLGIGSLKGLPAPKPGSTSYLKTVRKGAMNNLHRELAPVSTGAWAGIEEEAKRTFARHAAARKAVDVTGPDGVALAGVGTGHVTTVDPPADGVTAALRDWRPVVELRVPFTLSRAEIDSVERGALDPDWQPVKDAAKKIAFAEDRAVFDGYAAAQITGVRQASSNPALTLPGEVRDYPDVVSKAISALRLAGVAGPYSLVLSAGAWTAVSETSDHGYPIREHLARLLDGDIIWAPAIDGALLVSGRGGDYELRLGQDLSIGYLSHDAESVQLYFTESFTFTVYTTEASVTVTA